VRITARLEEGTVKELLDQLLPARVLLDDADKERWIQLGRASHVDFVPGTGLRVATSGELHWRAAGLPISVAFHSAQLMVRPMVLADDHGGRLVFRPSLEELDLKNVPSFLDSGVVAIINSRLAGQEDALAWHFGQNLARSFPMSGTIVPAEALELGAGQGQVAVVEDALVFSLELSLSFARAAMAAPAPG
jgi:hypothetical protein